MEPRVVLVSVGEVPEGLAEWLRPELGETLGLEVVGRERIPLQDDWFDPVRRQCRGPDILDALGSVDRRVGDHILGLVESDCYAGGLNFVFGQASPRSRDAFVALPRLRQSFYGRPRDERLFRERVLKESLHELGHTWGFEHCGNPRCVMYFSNTLADTDAKSTEFCAECRRGQ